MKILKILFALALSFSATAEACPIGNYSSAQLRQTFTGNSTIDLGYLLDLNNCYGRAVFQVTAELQDISPDRGRGPRGPGRRPGRGGERGYWEQAILLINGRQYGPVEYLDNYPNVKTFRVDGYSMGREIRTLQLQLVGNIYVGAITVTLGGYTPTPPAPVPPAPVPPAPVPPPAYAHFVLGSMEQQAFSFRVLDTQDLYRSCVNFYQSSGLGNVDDIEVSVNSEPMQKFHNSSSWWKGPLEVCGQVVKHARSRGVPDGGRFSIIAQIEDRWEMNLQGGDRNYVVQQCMEQYRALGISGNSVDDVVLYINYGEQRRLHNSTGWWQNAADLCITIANAL